MICFSRVLSGSLCSGLLLVAGAVTSSAQSDHQPSIVPHWVASVPGLGIAMTNTPDAAAFHRAVDGKVWELSAPTSFQLGGGGQVTVQELRYDPDPLIYNNILVQNITGSVQNYVISLNLPTVWGVPNYIRGSVDTSIIGTDGLISAPVGGALYTALIDGLPVQTLQNSPFSLSTPQAANSSFASFGFDPNNIPVLSSIGIQLAFTLSPGDTAAILSDFELVSVNVPEPGTLALLLVGGGFLAIRRRRH